MAAHDPTHKGPLIPLGLTPEEKAHHLEHLPPGLQLSKEELEEYKRAEFETKDWFGRSIAQFERLGNKEKVEELEKRRIALETRTPPVLAEDTKSHESHNESLGPLHHKPQYLDHDERYKKMVEEKVASWNKEHPNEPLPQEVLKTRDDGSRYIHQEITKKMPTIEEDVKKEFAEKHDDDFKEYEINEKSRVYKDKDGNALPENDPAYKKLLGDIDTGVASAKEIHEKSVQEATDAEMASVEAQHAQNAKTTFAYSARKTDRGEVEKKVRDQMGSSEKLESSTRHEKLLAFIATHPQKAAEYAKKSPELQLALREYQEMQAREHAQKDVARQVAEGIRKQQLPADDSLTPEEYAQVSPEKIELVAVPVNSENYSGGDEYVEEDTYYSENQYTTNRSRRRISPGGMLQNAGRAARGMRNAAQTAAKVGNVAAKAAPILTNPIFWIALGILLFIVLLIIIIVSIVGSGNEDNTATFPVTITKTGPEEVSPGENITYTINVSYSGPASDIVITDNIPLGSEFVSASGNYSCEPEPTCNPPEVRTITWHANLQSAPSPSGTPTPSASPTPSTQPGVSTIHNLGFGASDAKRIDDLVSKLSPGSPVIGQGGWVIERAREFNLDPLMIILFKNESQFCNDTGVVSPDGSDPDNYNCGGILWPSAQQETDIARWSARAGPAAYTHIFTFVPTVQDGIGLFFDYASASFYQGKTLQQFYDIYNPCSDSSQYGLACGAPEAERMLQLLADTLGPACTDGADCYSGGGGTSFPPMSFTLTVKPLGEGYIINQASAQVR